MFKSIKENAIVEVVEKKSKFIANVFYVESREESEEIIKKVNKQYHDARHNCYAYRVIENENITEKSSDDGEPSGTAGAPMLNILSKNNYANVLVIVTRYFGGILLGTGGLVRAYSEATSSVIENSIIIKKDYGFEVSFETEYPELEKMKYYFRQNNIKIIDTQYGEKIKIIVEITEEKLKKMENNKNELNFKFDNQKIEQKRFIEFVE